MPAAWARKKSPSSHGPILRALARVIIQVTGYRWAGRRLLLCSPLHNHFVLRGDSETKIVVRFWIASALLALLGIASLKIR